MLLMSLTTRVYDVFKGLSQLLGVSSTGRRGFALILNSLDVLKSLNSAADKVFVLPFATISVSCKTP